MGTMNMGRVVLGGLLAGLVINVGEFIANMFVFADAMSEMMSSAGLAEPGGAEIAVYTVMAFLGGIVMVWIYAAIRPRFGPGPRTAAMAATVTWILWYLFPTVGMAVMGLFPVGMTMVLVLIWGFVEFQLATQAGGWLYTEPGSPPMA